MAKEGNSNKAAQNHIKLIMANNTDIQPRIFQNPVLIFLNKQFKAQENNLVIVTKKKLDRDFLFL